MSIAITETEAYSGAADPASHAYRAGHPATPSCSDRRDTCTSTGPTVSTGAPTSSPGTDGIASAVLVRAGRVVEGRGPGRVSGEGRRSRAHASRGGPGNLCRALGITAEHNGTDLLAGAPVTLSEGEPVSEGLIRIGPSGGREQSPRLAAPLLPRR
ncbi:hypothetical protein GCM10023238_02790 [Streptomyces heliomycini]